MEELLVRVAAWLEDEDEYALAESGALSAKYLLEYDVAAALEELRANS